MSGVDQVGGVARLHHGYKQIRRRSPDADGRQASSSADRDRPGRHVCCT